jgi:methionyl-tRNA formyltransferase
MTESLAVPPSDIRSVVFLGTPDVSAVALRSLVAAGFDVPLVVSRPDRRRGRGSTLIPSPVKQAAIDLGLPTSDDLGDVADVEADLGVVVAYGRIIPMTLLTKLAMVNIHFSLLPRWRGAAPVERAILAGDDTTGVCVMEVAEGLDEGGVYAMSELPIGPDETATELRGRLGVVGAELLVETLRSGLGEAAPQVGEITYASKIEKHEARLDFDQSALQLNRTIRVGRAWAEFRSKRLGIEQAAVHERAASSTPGTVDGVTVSTGDGVLEMMTVKPEGKRSMAAQDWANGVQPKAGERLV